MHDPMRGVLKTLRIGSFLCRVLQSENDLISLDRHRLCEHHRICAVDGIRNRLCLDERAAPEERTL